MKILKKIEEFIKECYKELIVYLVILIICLFPLPYYIEVGGTLLEVNDKITVENSSKEEGKFYLAAVKVQRAHIPTYLLSYIFDWQLDPIEFYTINKDESEQDVTNREKIMLMDSTKIATYNAFKLANERIDIKNESFIVIGKYDESNSNIKVGDELVSIEGIKIKEKDTISKFISNKKEGDKVKIIVNRDGKEIECYAKVFEKDDSKIIGLYMYKIYDYDLDRKIEFNNKGKEGGSSGGLIYTLAIYNKITDYDLTKGRKIVGTGTIDYDGTVGEIDGVKYKLKGAVKKKADIFLCPEGNYEEAIKEKEKHNYKIEIVKVKNIEEAINYLKGE